MTFRNRASGPGLRYSLTPPSDRLSSTEPAGEGDAGGEE